MLLGIKPAEVNARVRAETGNPQLSPRDQFVLKRQVTNVIAVVAFVSRFFNAPKTSAHFAAVIRAVTKIIFAVSNRVFYFRMIPLPVPTGIGRKILALAVDRQVVEVSRHLVSRQRGGKNSTTIKRRALPPVFARQVEDRARAVEDKDHLPVSIRALGIVTKLPFMFRCIRRNPPELVLIQIPDELLLRVA